jgi:hypothetical protein
MLMKCCGCSDDINKGCFRAALVCRKGRDLSAGQLSVMHNIQITPKRVSVRHCSVRSSWQRFCSRKRRC